MHSTSPALATRPSPPATSSPWLGLASFTEETRALFHGRDGEIADLALRVRRKQLTVLFGQSGLGKTSLVRAGLVPALRPDGFCPVYLRLHYEPDAPPPAEQIKQEVLRATAVAGTWTRPGSAHADESLWEFFHHRDDFLHDESGQTLTPLLIFDQFEEIFTLAQSDDAGRSRARAFLAELADLVENRVPLALEQDETATERFDFNRADTRILIALREDYLAHLEGLRDLMPSITQNRVRLTRMSGAQALEVVLRPGAGLVGEDVARAIVRFVAGGAEIERAEIEPSLLSLVCRELDETRRARGAPEISADLLAGSRDTILSEFYERTVGDQPAAVRAFIEDHLLTDSGFRESVAEERVRRACADAGAPGALVTLVDRRLLRIEERLDVRRVELTHDVLCGVVAASRDTRHVREARETTVRQLAESHAREQTTRRALWRARLIATGASLLALVAIASAVFGYLNLRRARTAESTALHARQLADTVRAQAESLVSFMMEDLRRGLEERGTSKLLKDSAEAAIRYYETLPAESRDTKTDHAYAIALEGAVWVRLNLGDKTGAEQALLAALDLRRSLSAKAPDDPENAWRCLRDEWWLPEVRSDEPVLFSEAFNREVLRRAGEVRARFPDSHVVKRYYAHALNIFAFRARGPWVGFGRPQDGLEAAIEAESLVEELFRENPQDPLLPQLKRWTLGNQAGAYAGLARHERAVELQRQVVRLAEEALEADPGSMTLRASVADELSDLAGMATAISAKSGVEIERRAREHYRILTSLDPSNRWWKGRFAYTHFRESMYLSFHEGLNGPAREAFRRYDASLEGLEDHPSMSETRVWVAVHRACLAAVVGDEEEARLLAAEAPRRFEAHAARLVEGSLDLHLAHVRFLQEQSLLAAALRDWPWLHRLAHDGLQEIDVALREHPASDELILRRGISRGYLGWALLGKGDARGAIPVLQQALAELRDAPSVPRIEWAEELAVRPARERLAQALAQTGETGQARDLLESAVVDREAAAAKPEAPWQAKAALAHVRALLAGLLDPAIPAEAARRRQLLDAAHATLTSPEAEGRITVEGKETLAKVAALRATASDPR